MKTYNFIVDMAAYVGLIAGGFMMGMGLFGLLGDK